MKPASSLTLFPKLMTRGACCWWTRLGVGVVAMALLLGLVVGDTPQKYQSSRDAELVDNKLTALLFYATDEEEIGEDKAPLKSIADTGQDTPRYLPALKKAASAAHYHLIGKDSAALSATYSIWLRPSPQFPLQIENTGVTDDGGLSIYWILWQKEPVNLRKDRELVKSNTILTKKTPLVIAGPKWRGGRLLFVVRQD